MYNFYFQVFISEFPKASGYRLLAGWATRGQLCLKLKKNLMKVRSNIYCNVAY